MQQDQITYVIKDKNEHPFDESLIPKEYKHFLYKTINSDSYRQLRKDLLEIKEPFKNELGGLNSQNENVFYNYNDWESELCYTQGKYMEFISWEGTAPPFYSPNEGEVVANVTYRKLSSDELAYYLYWRTEFKKGNYVQGYRACYYLFFYEILIGIGGFDTQTSLNYMDNICDHCISKMPLKGLISRMKPEFERYHNVYGGSQFPKSKSRWKEEWDIILYEIYQKNYTHAFEYMDKIATYQLSSSSFIKATKCKNQIVKCILLSLPKIDKLFAENGLTFSDFLVGKIKVSRLPFEESIWTKYTRQRVLTKTYEPYKAHREKKLVEVFLIDRDCREEIRKSKISVDCDVVLANYIFKKTESKFREYMHWDEKLKVEAPIAYQFISTTGDYFTLPVDQEIKHILGKYYSLYPKISPIITRTVSTFWRNNMKGSNEKKI